MKQNVCIPVSFCLMNEKADNLEQPSGAIFSSLLPSPRCLRRLSQAPSLPAGLVVCTAPKAHSSSPATDRNPAVRLARAKARGRLHAKNVERESGSGNPAAPSRRPAGQAPLSRPNAVSLESAPQKSKYCTPHFAAHSSVPATDRNPAVRLARAKAKRRGGQEND